MKTTAKLLALCLLLGTFAFAQNAPAGGTTPSTTDASKPGDTTKTDAKDAKGKKGKKSKKDKKDQKADTTKTGDAPK